MKVREVMTENVEIINASESIRKAAQMMRDGNYGVLPVGMDDRLQGMVTDRDIVLWLADPGSTDPEEANITECMSPKVYYCYDDDDLHTIEEQMAELQCRRLPVLNRDKRLVGIVSLGDLSLKERDHQAIHHTLSEVSRH